MMISERWRIVREPYGLRLEEEYATTGKNNAMMIAVRKTWHATIEQCAQHALTCELSEQERADVTSVAECVRRAREIIYAHARAVEGNEGRRNELSRSAKRR